MLKGVLLTAKADPDLLVRETLRRIFGLEYEYNKVKVKDAVTFRVLRSAILRGYRFWMEGDKYYVETPWSILSAPQASLLGSAINADFDAMYGGDYNGMIVADIGGYIGETALYFISKGAKFVYVYEPVFWREAEFNLRGKPAKVFPYGIWWDRREVKLSVENSMTGLRTGDYIIETIPLSEVLQVHNPDVIKMNCEGCEYSLLLLDCRNIITRRWIVEIHGPEPVLIEKFRECGLEPHIVERRYCTSVIYASEKG